MASATRAPSPSSPSLPWKARIRRSPCSQGFSTRATASPRKNADRRRRLLCRLLAFGETGELSQDFSRARQPLFRRLPFLKEHHFHVGADPRGLAVLADEIDQPIGLREFVVAEGDDRALRSGIDLLDIGPSA